MTEGPAGCALWSLRLSWRGIRAGFFLAVMFSEGGAIAPVAY